jgi:hypothetical protein
MVGNWWDGDWGRKKHHLMFKDHHHAGIGTNKTKKNQFEKNSQIIDIC